MVLDSSTLGPYIALRRTLASLLDAQASGRDPLDVLAKWGSAKRKKVIGFLMDQLDVEETTHRTSRLLFKFLAQGEVDTHGTSNTMNLDEPLQAHPTRGKPKEDKKDTFWLRVPWSREEFKDCKLQQFLSSQAAAEAHPIPSLVPSTRISYSLNKPLKLLLCNFTQVCKEKPYPVPDPAQCPCRRYRTACSLSYHGHVISTDLEALQDASLKQL